MTGVSSKQKLPDGRRFECACDENVAPSGERTSPEHTAAVAEYGWSDDGISERVNSVTAVFLDLQNARESMRLHSHVYWI